MKKRINKNGEVGRFFTRVCKRVFAVGEHLKSETPIKT